MSEWGVLYLVLLGVVAVGVAVDLWLDTWRRRKR